MLTFVLAGIGTLFSLRGVVKATETTTRKKNRHRKRRHRKPTQKKKKVEKKVEVRNKLIIKENYFMKPDRPVHTGSLEESDFVLV